MTFSITIVPLSALFYITFVQVQLLLLFGFVSLMKVFSKALQSFAKALSKLSILVTVSFYGFFMFHSSVAHKTEARAKLFSSMLSLTN